MSEGIPEGWKTETLDEVSNLITKGTTPTTYGHDYVTSGVNFLRVENISSHGTITLNGVKFISEETNELLSRSKLKKDDLLISIAGAIGRTAIVGDKDLPANLNQAIAIVRLKGVVNKFIQLFVGSEFVQNQFETIQAGLAQINFNLKQIGELVIFTPPLPDQQNLISRVEYLKNVKQVDHALLYHLVSKSNL